MGDLLPPHHLMIYLIIDLYQYGTVDMNIYFLLWVIIRDYHICCSNCFSFGH